MPSRELTAEEQATVDFMMLRHPNDTSYDRHGGSEQRNIFRGFVFVPYGDRYESHMMGTLQPAHLHPVGPGQEWLQGLGSEAPNMSLIAPSAETHEAAPGMSPSDNASPSITSSPRTVIKSPPHDDASDDNMDVDHDDVESRVDSSPINVSDAMDIDEAEEVGDAESSLPRSQDNQDEEMIDVEDSHPNHETPLALDSDAAQHEPSPPTVYEATTIEPAEPCAPETSAETSAESLLVAFTGAEGDVDSDDESSILSDPPGNLDELSALFEQPSTHNSPSAVRQDGAAALLHSDTGYMGDTENDDTQAAPKTRAAVSAAKTPRKRSTGAGGHQVLYESSLWSEQKITWWLFSNPDKSRDDLPHAALHGEDHILWTHATPATVDITVLGDTFITIEELMTYFPLHYIWVGYANRLACSGWSASTLIRFVYRSRGITTGRPLVRGTISGNFQRAIAARHPQLSVKNGKYKAPAKLASLAEQGLSATDQHSCRAWTTEMTSAKHSEEELIKDWYLKDLANGVAVMPQGREKGVLTMALELAVERGDNPKLSELTKYVGDNRESLNLQDIHHEEDSDAQALEKHRNDLLEYAQTHNVGKD
ncbi:hypothetical protein M011DRAFT_462559 [Sporormia fimetaria CBS 119925]|uniref:Uncharacterized protein n=1 Tax=Sporormia fimetaria CBS 119925 TaxID=1340428 RepID=A0A6A6UVM9_9PLEO|nr:hypothetical protein M011DRAFT_462559 [Sporormia fimetaria CBS 119925]